MSQKKEKNYVWVFRGERVILRGRDICYVYTHCRKTFVCTGRREYRFGGSLRDMEQMLSDLPMVKTHSAYLVNMDFLESISIRGAVLKDGTRISVSPKRWRQVRENVAEYCSECKM